MSLLRPRDTDALRAELRHLATETSLPLAFGGEVHGDTLLLSEFVGTRTGAHAWAGGATQRGPRRGDRGGPQTALGTRLSAGVRDHPRLRRSGALRGHQVDPGGPGGRRRPGPRGALRRLPPIGADRRSHRRGDGLLGAQTRPRTGRPRRGGPTAAAARGASGEFRREHGRAEQIREVHAELRRLAVDAPSPLQARLRHAGGRAGRRRPDRQHPVDGARARRAGAGRAWGAPMPKRPNAFR